LVGFLTTAKGFGGKRLVGKRIALGPKSKPLERNVGGSFKTRFFKNQTKKKKKKKKRKKNEKNYFFP